MFPYSAIWEAAMTMLPPSFNSPKAKAIVAAIGMQEGDGFKARRQYNNGPARSFYQFEQGGVRGVLEHQSTRPLIVPILDNLRYGTYPIEVWSAIEHNDVLATIMARLLIYTDPRPLPGPGEAAKGWTQYLWCWRPGAPHEAKWAASWAAGWQMV